MKICEFSKKVIPAGKGKMYVKKDGKILHFYSSKEQKNYLKLKRKGRETKWTNEYHAIKKGTRD